MTRLPKWNDLWRYPAVVAVASLAVGITVAWWAKIDISPLLATAEIRRGQLWRLATCIFPHLDVLHLVFNVYWLLVFGSKIEEVYGHARTVVLILILAVGSSALDFAFDSGGVGLSGVGYGLFGLLWVVSAHDERFRGLLDRRTINLFVGWFILCVFTTVTHVFLVANVAHAAGAVLGGLIGYAVSVPNRRLQAIAAVTGIILFGIWGATQGRPILNFSGRAGYEEGRWGYEALIAGQNDHAVQWLNEAARLQPNEPAYWFNLGIAYQRIGNLSAAAAAYKRAHELRPDDSEYSQPLRGANLGADSIQQR